MAEQRRYERVEQKLAHPTFPHGQSYLVFWPPLSIQAIFDLYVCPYPILS